MTASPYWVWSRYLVLAIVASGLSACAALQSELSQLDQGIGATIALDHVAIAQNTGTSGEAISRNLEPAPEVFEATGLAEWDGKRTLRGIWVAHPLARTARRVRIFNTENNRAADGALFKRDTALGGPSVLISSEAAEVLGMQPGRSVELRIVAVTPVQRTDPPAPAPQADVIDETATPVQNQTLQQAATPATPNPEPAEPPETEPETATAETTEDPAPEPPVTAEPQETFKWEPAETVEVPQADTQPEAEVRSSDETAAVDPVPAPSAPETKIEPVQPRQPEPRPDTEFKFEPPPQPEPAHQPEPAQEQQVAAATSKLRRPFIQAGVFGVRTNATRLVSRLEKRGIPARTRKVGNGTLTKVLAGPFQTIAERNKAQRTIRAMGMSDAVPVKR